MNKKIEKKDGRLLISATFDEKEYNSSLNKAEINLAKEVTVPGYRKGHASLELAKRYIKSDTLGNELINTLLRSLEKELKNEKFYETYSILNIRPDVNVSKFEPKETIIEVNYTLTPEIVKLGEYKGLKSEIKEKKITDKEIDDELKRLAKDNEDLVSVDREAKIGDTANIDFVGYLDGKPFDGGEGKNFDLELGSNHFVPGFEEQIVSHKPGEKFEINVKMPDNYPEGLANKDTVFKVTINSIKEPQLPEINDEFATTLTGEYVSKDLNELKEKISNKLNKDAKNQYLSDRANDYLLKCRDSSTFEIADNYIKLLVEDRIAQERDRIAQQGLSLEEYLKLIKEEYSDFEKSIKDNVIAEIKNQLVYDSIFKNEKLENPSNAEIEKSLGMPLQTFISQYSNYLKMQKMSDNQISNEIRRYTSSIFASLLQQKVIDKVLILNGDKEEKVEEKSEEKEVKKPSKTSKKETIKEDSGIKEEK